MNRILAVTRMHLTDRITLFGVIPAILSASFLINMLIFTTEPVHARTTGGVAALFIWMLIVAAMSTARGMGFALSMGASRRAFALGTGLTGALLAVGYGVLLLILNRVEAATGGWWLHGHFFTFGWLTRHSFAATWLLATLLLLAMFLLGGLMSTVWLRWRQIGALVGGVACFLVFGGLILLVNWQHEWAAVARWFAALTPLAAAGWTALTCAVLIAASYPMLRRVTL